MQQQTFDVQVSRDEGAGWVVSLDAAVVASFISVVDALAFAGILECSPRARAEALRT